MSVPTVQTPFSTEFFGLFDFDLADGFLARCDFLVLGCELFFALIQSGRTFVELRSTFLDGAFSGRNATFEIIQFALHIVALTLQYFVGVSERLILRGFTGIYAVDPDE